MKEKNCRRIEYGKSTLLRIMLLVMMLTAMLVMTGCRTRLSNNSEISNIYPDTGETMMYYNERRDELGLSTAKKPLMPDLGGGEEDDEEYFDDYNGFDDYEPGTEEPYVEPPEVQQQQNSNTSRPSTTTGPSTTTRPGTRPSTPTNTSREITIKLDAKEGSCKPKEIKVKTGGTYSRLSTVKVTPPSGKKFDHWENQSGVTISQNSPVPTSASGHTLIAKYKSDGSKKKEEKKKKYDITLSANGHGNDSSKTVTEGGKYSLEKLSNVPGYTFQGWNTESDGSGKWINDGDTVPANPPTTIYAQWKKKGDQDYWQDMFKEAKKSASEFTFYMVDGGDSSALQDCGGKTGNVDSAKYVVKIINDWDEEKVAEEYQALYDEYGDRVVLISKKTNGWTGKKKLYYEIVLLDKLQGIMTQADAEYGGSPETDLGLNYDEVEIWP